MFNGPPETIKELILCSAHCMSKGDWKKCSDLVMSLKIYNHHKNSKEIKAILNDYIKETSLKCYLIFYSNQFNSISLDSLTKRFLIDEPTARRIINGMILDEEIDAKWNRNTLEIFSFDNNYKIIKRLEGNLTTLTEQNLTLIEITSSTKK